MASLSNDPGGRRRIIFTAPDGNRTAIRLGKLPKKAAEAIKARIEALLAARVSGCAWDNPLAEWVSNLDEQLGDKLVKVGLIRNNPKASNDTLGSFLDGYAASRPTLKSNTKRNHRVTTNHLVNHFGREKRLRAISPGDADQWREHLLMDMAPTTVAREVKRARQFFRAAVRQRLIPENPFAEVKGGSQENRNRFYFITREEADKVLAACPNAEWRLIFALARFGGLRTPSDTLALRWGDVDWERNRLRVPSPKTEHHPDGASRIIPLFPELREHLEAAWEEAEPGTEHVITTYRDSSINLRSRTLDIIWAAGLKEWPKLFQDLRSTRETELAETFPMHVVCKWIGNSEPVAAKHYLQVTDEHFQRASEGGDEAEHDAKAARNAAQYVPELGSTGQHKKQQTPIIPEEYEGLPLCTSEQVPPRGVEPLSSD